MTGSTSKLPWTRIFVEGGVIVVSILLAFALDAWWDGQQERQAAREILIGLEAEFVASLEDLERTQERHQIRIEAIDGLLRATSTGPAGADPDSVAEWLVWLGRGTSFDPVHGTLDAVLGEGSLDLIEDLELRAAIAAWPSRAGDYVASEGNAMDVILRDIWPYLRAHTGMPRVGNFRIYPPSRWEVDLEGLLNDREFENLMVEARYWEASVRGDGRTLFAETQAVIDRIRDHLDGG